MKKIALSSLVAVMAVSAANAATPYVAGHVGYTVPTATLYQNHEHNGAFMNDDFAYDLSVAFGVKQSVMPGLAIRGEVEYDFANGFVMDDGADNMWMRSNTVLANVYLDMKTILGLTPYVGAGAGYQWNHINADIDNPHSFAWQVGGGIAYTMCNTWTFDLGYRYLSSVDKVDSAIADKFHVAYHQFRLGAAYSF